MQRQQVIIVLVIAIAFAAIAAWIVLNPVAEERARRPGEACSASAERAPKDDGDDAAKPDANAKPTELKSNKDAADKARKDAEEQQRAADEQRRKEEEQARKNAETNGGNSGGGNSGTPAQPRQLTPREREELARQNGGRDAYRARLEASGANNGKAEASIKKSAKQEEWKKQWGDEGLEPPEMVATQITGKVMSQQSREGLAKAVVGVITLFPVNGQRGGAIWPVLTELTCDDAGNFSGEVPASPNPPLYTAPVALTVAAESYRAIAGMPVTTFYAGQLNSLGIFWAPETPFTVECDATQFSEPSLEIITTGQLDPQRWHPSKRGPVLNYFSHTAVPAAAKDKPERKAKVASNWDEKAPPFMTLMSSGAPVQTKRCVRKKTASQASNSPPPLVQEPFDTLVFESSGFSEISGQVVDAQGAGIANATVATLGDNENIFVLTDSLGFFRFEKPPKKTNMLVAAHDDYVAVIQKDVVPGMSSVRITFTDKKPVLVFHLRDQLTQVDITSVSVKLYGPPDAKGVIPAQPATIKEMSSQNGVYIVKSDTLLGKITLEKLGYFPRTILDPVKAQAAGQAQGEWAMTMNPGRKLEVRPRDKTAVQMPERWFQDDQKPDDPAIWTYWSHHWIEYTIDFGSAPEAGVEGGHFDIMLGCRNEGIVDNNYQFQVKVYVDDTEKVTLTINANTLTEQFGRKSLGQLSGVRRIRLVWQNDSWIPDQLDANIRYQSLKFLEQPGP